MSRYDSCKRRSRVCAFLATIGDAIMHTRSGGGGRRHHRRGDAFSDEATATAATAAAAKEGNFVALPGIHPRGREGRMQSWRGRAPGRAYSVKYTLLSMPSARCSIHLRSKWNYKRIPPAARGSPLAADTFCAARLTPSHTLNQLDLAEASCLRDPPAGVCPRLRAELLRSPIVRVPRGETSWISSRNVLYFGCCADFGRLEIEGRFYALINLEKVRTNWELMKFDMKIER